MTQTKKKKTAQGRRGKKAGLSWQTRPESRAGMIAAMVIAGLALALICYFLQMRGVFALNAGQQAAENSPVRINEIVSRNESCLITETGDVPDWVEITNAGSKAVNIGRCGLLLKSNINNMLSFPAYDLQPGETLLIHCDGQNSTGTQWRAPFKLDSSGGDTLILLGASGSVIDGVTLPELDADRAYARQADGSWLESRPTPGRDNDDDQQIAFSDAESQSWNVELSEASSANTLYFADENGLCKRCAAVVSKLNLEI